MFMFHYAQESASGMDLGWFMLAIVFGIVLFYVLYWIMDLIERFRKRKK